MSHECKYCGALKFKEECPSACCNIGKILLPPFPQPPKVIYDLLHGTDKKSQLLRKCLQWGFSLSHPYTCLRLLCGKPTPNCNVLNSAQIKSLKCTDGFNDSVMIANNALTSILASEEKTPVKMCSSKQARASVCVIRYSPFWLHHF